MLAETPRFFGCLTASEQQAYRSLQARLATSRYRNRRRAGKEARREALQEVLQFCIPGGQYDATRCLVCGIFVSPTMFAVIPRRLGIILGKTKSSINEMLQHLGWIAADRKDHAVLHLELKKGIPMIPGDDERKWTFRKDVGERRAVRSLAVPEIAGNPEPAPNRPENREHQPAQRDYSDADWTTMDTWGWDDNETDDGWNFDE